MNDDNKSLTVTSSQPAELPEAHELEFFKSVCELIQQARRNVEKHINTAMTVTYYEIGRRIIEQEQHGEKRAQYGKRILYCRIKA